MIFSGSGGALGMLLDAVGFDWRSPCFEGVTPFASAEKWAGLAATEEAALLDAAKKAHDHDGALMTLAGKIAALK